MNFYEISQNNSGGSFVVNDKLCHRLIIEAASAKEAWKFAKTLGCYANGCAKGKDCSCCGDRWYKPSEYDVLDLDKYNKEEFEIDYYGSGDLLEGWNRLYGNLEKIGELHLDKKYSFNRAACKVKFNSILEYLQCTANRYGWTTPDIRVFYKNGDIKEIFKNK